MSESGVLIQREGQQDETDEHRGLSYQEQEDEDILQPARGSILHRKFLTTGWNVGQGIITIFIVSM